MGAATRLCKIWKFTTAASIRQIAHSTTPFSHDNPESTGKMKYLHSEETLDIPEGGMIDSFRFYKNPSAIGPPRAKSPSIQKPARRKRKQVDADSRERCDMSENRCEKERSLLRSAERYANCNKRELERGRRQPNAHD